MALKHDDRVAPESMASRDDGTERQNIERDDHDVGRFVDMLRDVVLRAGSTMEGHEEETPGIERGHEGDSYPHDVGVIAKCRAGTPGGFEDHVFREKARERGQA